MEGWVVECLEFGAPGVVEDVTLRVGLDVRDDFNGRLVGDVLVPLAVLGTSWMVLFLGMRSLRDGCWHRLNLLGDLLLILDHWLLLLDGRGVVKSVRCCLCGWVVRVIWCLLLGNRAGS